MSVLAELWCLLADVFWINQRCRRANRLLDRDHLSAFKIHKTEPVSKCHNALKSFRICVTWWSGAWCTSSTRVHQFKHIGFKVNKVTQTLEKTLAWLVTLYIYHTHIYLTQTQLSHTYWWICITHKWNLHKILWRRSGCRGWAAGWDREEAVSQTSKETSLSVSSFTLFLWSYHRVIKVSVSGYLFYSLCC